MAELNVIRKSTCFTSLILLFLGSVNSLTLFAASEDDYLNAIEVETNKVEAKTIDAETPSTPTTVVTKAGEGFASGLSISEFEQELLQKYTGTGRFYSKLPRRNQEEVYQNYLKGASITEVRKTIMNRYLHR